MNKMTDKQRELIECMNEFCTKNLIQLMKDQKKKQENILVKILKGGDRND